MNAITYQTDPTLYPVHLHCIDITAVD